MVEKKLPVSNTRSIAPSVSLEHRLVTDTDRQTQGLLYGLDCVKPHPSALNMTLPASAAEGERRIPAIDRYLLQAPALSSKPAARRCCCQSTGQRDGRTDTRPLHRSSTAYYTDSVNKPRNVRSILVTGVNAPLPPEAKKIVKI